MKKTLFVVMGVISVVAVLGSLGAFIYVKTLKGKPFSGANDVAPTFSEEEIVAMTKPGVVRIVQTSKGEASLPDFRVNFDTGEVTVAPEKPWQKRTIDDVFAGSGFVIRKDGYVVTNAHVVSNQVVKQQIAKEYTLRFAESLMTVLMAAGMSNRVDQLPPDLVRLILMPESVQKVIFKTMGENIFKLAVEKGEYRVGKQMTVLNPRSSGDKIEELVEKGFPAAVVSVNDTFLDDERDLALLKIDKQDLPALTLGDSKSLAAGNKVHVFGFPSSAEINQRNFLEATFTQGSVSAVKDSKTKQFKLYQTDAKVSAGSSGGPMFDAAGNVVGIITYATAVTQGDNFAFAIPVEILAESLRTFVVQKDKMLDSLDGPQYAALFSEGLALEKNRHCQAAVEKYQEAERYGVTFSAADYSGERVKSCEKLIAAGGSVDSLYDERRDTWAGIDEALKWIIGFGGLLLVVSIGGVALLLKRVQKSEEEIDHLEDVIEDQTAGRTGTASPLMPPPLLGRSFFRTLSVPEEHLVLGSSRAQDISGEAGGV